MGTEWEFIKLAPGEMRAKRITQEEHHEDIFE
jgi:hypothetical protein